MGEDEPALPIGERDQADGDAVLIRDQMLELRRPSASRRVVRSAMTASVMAGASSKSRDVLCNRISDLGESEREHLASQRLVERGEPVEFEHVHHRPKSEPVDQQREQDKAGGENRHEALRRGLDATAFRDRERQCQA